MKAFHYLTLRSPDCISTSFAVLTLFVANALSKDFVGSVPGPRKARLQFTAFIYK